jgi:glycosyltransferase involved in cell wall biosynthesis
MYVSPETPERQPAPADEAPVAAKLQRLVVTVPAFNEAETIERTVEGLRGTEPQLAARGYSLAVYVIDDGSSDGTGDLARAAGAERVIRHRVNQGLGAAVRTAIRAAREDGFDLLVKFDADLQHDPADIVALIDPIRADEADVVYGNRFERISYRMPPVRRIGNIVFSRLMRWLTGWPLQDSQPGIFAINRAYIDVSFIPGDYNYTQQVLLDAYHKHMRFAHVPVSFHARKTGASFVSLKYPLKVLPQIAFVVVSVKPMKAFVPVGMFFIGLATVVFCVQFLEWLFGSAARPVENVNLVMGSFLFGVQTVFIGVLAQLIIQMRR